MAGGGNNPVGNNNNSGLGSSLGGGANPLQTSGGMIPTPVGNNSVSGLMGQMGGVPGQGMASAPMGSAPAQNPYMGGMLGQGMASAPMGSAPAQNPYMSAMPGQMSLGQAMGQNPYMSAMPGQGGDMGQNPYMGGMPVPLNPYSTTTAEDMMGRGGSGVPFMQAIGQLGLNPQGTTPAPQTPFPEKSNMGGIANLMGLLGNQPQVAQPRQPVATPQVAQRPQVAQPRQPVATPQVAQKPMSPQMTAAQNAIKSAPPGVANALKNLMSKAR